MALPLEIDPLADFRRQMQALRRPLGQSSVPSELPQISPEEEESLMAELAGSVGSGLGWVAQTLDKPGRAVRGLLAGQPEELLNLIPFSDTIGITDPQQSVSGRDLLTSWGLTEPNNPDEWEVADFLGFGAEVLTDPLLPLGLGKGALTASGKAARAAGVLDDATRIAGKGPRVSRMTTTLDDLAAQSPEAAEAIKNAGGVLGVDEPLGGVASYFGHTFAGPTAQKVGGVLDTMGEAISTSAPVRYLSSAFDRRLHGTLTPEVQKEALAFSEASARAKSKMDELLGEQMTRRIDADLITPEAGMGIRMAMEQVDPADIAVLKSLNPNFPDHLINHPVAQEIARDYRSAIDAIPAEAAEWGANIPILKDAKVKHVARQMTAAADKPGASARGSKPLSAENRFRMGRKGVLRNIGGGTEAVNAIIADTDIAFLIKHGKGLKDIAQVIERKYGSLVPPTMTVKNKLGKPVVKDQRRELARYIKTLSEETRKEGLFGNDVFFDLKRYFDSTSDSIEAAKTAFNVVTQRELHDPNGVKLGDLLTNLKIRHGDKNKGFMQKVANQLGISFKEAKKIKINADTAADLGRFHKSFEGPEATGKFMQIWDSANSLFKMGVLSWPSRHVRDFVSGMFSNFIGGELKSPADIGDAWKLMRGGVVNGAQNIPIIKKTMGIRGVHGDEEATKILRELVFAQNLVNKYGNVVGDITGVGTPARGTFEDLASAMPGSNPISLSELGQHAIPKSLAELNPLSTRGVNPINLRSKGDWLGPAREESDFFVAKTSEEVGYLTDTMNRLVPFISQLKRGVDPRTAKLKTNAMQVDYTPGAYTPLERQVVSRMVPFYRFTKGQVPWVLKQLWEHPGGKMPQTIRATEEARAEGFVPDYVGTGTAIPLGETEDGTQRYLSSLGLAHETVFDLFRPGRGSFDTAKETLSGLMGNLSPYIKLPIEVGTGKQLFTGRDLDELDSRLGRILNPSQPVSVPVLAEQAIMNSPLSKAVTTAGVLTDPRKSWGDVALNTLTGARVTDVDMDKAKYFASREALDKLLSSNPAVRKFSSLYVKDEDIERLDPSQQRAYALYRNVQKESQQRARERRQQEALTP
jgi:hypothetical protein